jgi:ATP-dependent DNA helicase DinG
MKKEYAYWIENEENPTLIAKPIDISEKLENLFDNKNIISPTNIVFTSATITTNKEFKFFIKNLGLPNNTKTTTVKSPFNYKEQARLYIPENSLSGTIATQNPDKYREYISKNIKKVAGITQRGIFALFTSYSAMEGTYEKIKNDLPFHNLLLQGNMNKNILLERFKKEKNSILFATYSFWEGVDVKGDDLGYVFIDKIPFEVHTDPLIVAKKNKMNDNGDNFFNDYYVPEAIIKLKQGFGRLIRTKLDYGAVIILDDRIIPGTKGYSKKIYNSFPDIDEIFTRDFKEVEALEKRKRKVVSISSIS